MKESGSCVRSCKSRRRTSRPQASRGVRKRCRIRAGWRHEWIPRTELPSRSVLAIREVVRGPFSSPRLVSASPYVLVSSNCKNGERGACKSAEICPRIKRGIPDPWAEYLAYRGFCSKDDQRTVRRDLDLGCKNIYVTATVWKDLGLPLGQGIPDPWKIPASRENWRTEKGPRLHGDKRHQRGYYEQSRATPGSSSRVGKAAVNGNPALSNPQPQQETRREEVSRRETLSRCANFTGTTPGSSPEYPSVNETPNCAVSFNPKRDNPRPVDTITSGTPGRSLAEPEHQIRQIQCVAKNHRPSIIDPVDQSTSYAVQQKLLPLDCATQTTRLQLTHGSSRKFKVRDAACMCEGSDLKKKRVGFETKSLPCTDRGGQTLNPNLNVTQLPCGCVHISSCNGMRGPPGSGNEDPGSGPRYGVASPGDAFQSENQDQTHWGFPQPEDRSYQDQKPKMMSRMRRLLNRYKPTSKSQHRTEKAQTVKSEVRSSQTHDSKLVCCQCSCPYLRIENPAPGASSKTVEKKKKKCTCGRCLAKRERREKRRSKKSALEEQQASISPKSCLRCFPIESPDQRVESDPRHVQMPTYEADIKKIEIRPPSAPPEDSTIIHEIKVAEKLLDNVNSLDAWEFPTAFGAPWYSSDSGENADVSEASRHTIQCSTMLQASPETSLVTSCTFISRINHSTVLQCLKKRERRPKKGESTRQELNAESIVGRNCSPQSDQDSTSCKTNCRISENQTPLLRVEKSKTNDSPVSPRPACIDPPMGSASFFKDETSQTSGSNSRNKTRRNSFKKRADSGKKEIAKDHMGPKANISRTTVGLDSIKSLKLLGAHLTETIIGETRNSTDVDNEELKAPNPSREIRETVHYAKSKDLCPWFNGTRSSCDRGTNFGYDPMITTIVSPRRISTNSSTTCNPDSSARKCRRARASANTTTGGSSSEDPRSSAAKDHAVVYRCEVPFTPGPCSFAKSFARSNETKNSRDSTPRYGIDSAGKMDGFLEGEGIGRSDLDITEETKDENPREFVQQLRILLPGETHQGGKRGPTDNKCYLKYCSLRRSGPCIVSPTRKTLRIQYPSFIQNDHCEDGIPGMTMGKQFPLENRAFFGSGNERNPALLGNDFSRASPRPLAKLQDKIDMG